MSQNTSKVIMIAICAAITGFAIHVTHEGWWTLAFVAETLICCNW